MRLSTPVGQLLQPRGLRRKTVSWPHTVCFRVGTAQALAVGLAATLLTTSLAALLLTYRLAVQFTASVPAGGPALWLYDAAGLLVLPFRPLDTTHTASSRALEFPALVALEAFLATGCLLGFLTFGGLRLARRLGSPVAEVYVDLDAAARDVADLIRHVRAFVDRSLVALGSAWLYAIAYLDTRDWEGMRRRLREAGRKAYSSLKRAAEVGVCEGAQATETACESVNQLAVDLAVAGGRGAALAKEGARLLPAVARGRVLAAVRPFERVRAAAAAGYGDAARRLQSGAGRAASGKPQHEGGAGHGISRREFFHRIGAGGAH
jgi:hypothetical protein